MAAADVAGGENGTDAVNAGDGVKSRLFAKGELELNGIDAVKGDEEEN